MDAVIVAGAAGSLGHAVARAVAPAGIAKVIAFRYGPEAAPISGTSIPVSGDG